MSGDICGITFSNFDKGVNFKRKLEHNPTDMCVLTSNQNRQIKQALSFLEMNATFCNCVVNVRNLWQNYRVNNLILSLTDTWLNMKYIPC